MFKSITGMFFLMLSTVIYAADISVNNSYSLNQPIIASVSNMTGQNQDWVGIYPEGSNNDWANVIKWAWTNDIENGNVSLSGVPTAGNYEVRAFYNNSYHLEASYVFSVVDGATISTQKHVYQPNEAIITTVFNMAGQNQDWVGIYPAGSNNDWANVIKWAWTNDIENGSVTLTGVPVAGSYEVRAFYNNSYHLEASDSFTIGGEPSITTQKNSYNINEVIITTVSNMAGQNQDWVGIYPEGSNNDWSNVVKWAWTNDIENGNISLSGVPTAGNYEVRAFYNNSFEVEAVSSFTVSGLFWEKGPYEVAQFLEFDIPTTNNQAIVYSPQGVNGDLPVVFFFYGGSANQHLVKHKTLLNFIASHGYHAILLNDVSYNHPEWTANQLTLAIDHLRTLKGVNSNKFGVIGHSSGGGGVYAVMKKLKEAPSNFGSDKSFLISMDTWFAFKMNQQDLRDLPEKTKVVLLQFGLGGNNMDDLPADSPFPNVNFSTDALIPLTIFNYLSEIYPENTGYHVVPEAGSTRGHMYLYDNFWAPEDNGNNYENMKYGLEPIGALMEYTFNENLAAKLIALRNEKNQQAIKPKDSYAYKCEENRYGIETDIEGKLAPTDVKYCVTIPR